MLSREGVAAHVSGSMLRLHRAGWRVRSEWVHSDGPGPQRMIAVQLSLQELNLFNSRGGSIRICALDTERTRRKDLKASIAHGLTHDRSDCRGLALSL